MNKTIYKQTDDRWKNLPFPGSGYKIGGSGCGCLSVTHVLMEIEKYKNYTPKDTQPYMKQFATKGSGLQHAGIGAGLKHFGVEYEFISESDPMSKAWKILAKAGYTAGVLLFYSRKGPDGTVWTSSGHFIAFTAYKIEDGKHWFYLKDSGGRNHSGWYCYEKSMKGDLPKLWICKIPGTKTPEKEEQEQPSTLTVDGFMGASTISASQTYFGTIADGEISGQIKSLKQYYPNITVSYGKGGSSFVRAWQKWAGTAEDGKLGKETIKAIQTKLKSLGYYNGKIDGVAGSGTVKAWQSFINGEKPKKEESKGKETKVIDVSYVQSSVDWEKVKAAGIEGVMVRCGYRGYAQGTLKEDSCFISHIKGAKKAGLKVGVYFFTEAVNAKEGKEEAAYTLNLIQKAGVPIDYPVAIDTEYINASARANGISKAKRTEAVDAFCKEIKAHGLDAMIYASTDWLNNKLDMSKLSHKVWVAQYNSCVTYKGAYVMWQYTSVAKLDGIKGVVDMNHCYL